MSGGAGGIVIIKDSMRSALSNPLVSGTLPDPLAGDVATVCAKDCDDWSHEDYVLMAFAFNYAVTHA